MSNIQKMISLHKIDNTLIDAIENGRLDCLNAEALEALLSILPSRNDMLELSQAIEIAGVKDFRGALEDLEMDKTQYCMFQLLCRRKLDTKARLLLLILRNGPDKLGTLIKDLSCWNSVQKKL